MAMWHANQATECRGLSQDYPMMVTVGRVIDVLKRHAPVSPLTPLSYGYVHSCHNGLHLVRSGELSFGHTGADSH